MSLETKSVGYIIYICTILHAISKMQFLLLSKLIYENLILSNYIYRFNIADSFSFFSTNKVFDGYGMICSNEKFKFVIATL